MINDSPQLEELVDAVLASPKYRAVSPDLVRTIGRRELAVRRGLKEAVKATKNKLHQVAGAYLDGQPRYEQWLGQLVAAAEPRTETGRRGDGETGRRRMTTDNGQRTTDDGRRTTSSQFQQACLDIMGHHASTRERIGVLRSFYTTTLASIQPVRSVLDVACGLNPLALAWMPLAPDVTYYACDIYADMMAFLNRFFEVAGVRGRAEVCDLVAGPPPQRVDLALILKALPPLEQVEPGAGLSLLRRLSADHMLVSFPARSLGGRSKGMAENYEQHFRELIAGEGWAVERFAFATEIAFLMAK
jgi:16S rRNA (guanine(1405)-N(7))-methyltransferase